jgi:parallel beta-helix repeat protein
VSTVATGSGLTGGPITTSGTISVATGGITGSHIADLTIAAADIASGAVTDTKITGPISGAKLGTHSHSGTDITDPTLGGLSCAEGQIAKWDGSQWTCAADNDGNVSAPLELTGTTTLAIIKASNLGTGGAGRFEIANIASSSPALFARTQGTGYAGEFDGDINVTGIVNATGFVGDGSALTGIADADTLGGLSCADGQVAKLVSGAWTCATDDTGGGTVSSVATGSGLTGGPITTSGTISVTTGGITGSHIADLTIATADIAGGAVTDAKITGPISGSKLGTHSHSGTDISSGVVAIANGGTGATTAAGARTSLGVAAATHGHTFPEITGTLQGSQLSGTYGNAVNLSNVANTFTGSGAGLTGLSASNLALGTVPSGRLAGTYSGALTFSNAANSFTGNGSGLANVDSDLLDGQHAADIISAASDEVRGPVSACGTISTPGSYYLTGNISATGTCITISADNVTLDLMGFAITGPGAASGNNRGIYISGSNVEVRNGTVRGFGFFGIYSYNSAANDSVRVVNVRAMGNGGTGIYLNSLNSLVRGCTAAGNGDDGIRAQGGSTVSGNTAYDNVGYGVFVYSGSTVDGNTVYGNGNSGIFANQGSTVIDNTVRGNTTYGIWAHTGSTVSGNTAYGNGSSGIYANEGSTVSGNTAYLNQQNGVILLGYNLVDGNTAYKNNQSGGAYTNMSTCGSCVFGVNVQ